MSSNIPTEPTTPLHARPNEQLDLNRVQELDMEDLNDLDLNPGFDESLPPSKVTSSTNLHNSNNNNNYNMNSLKRPRDMSEHSMNSEIFNTENLTKDNTVFDDVDDFKPIVNIASPFQEYHNNNNTFNNDDEGDFTKLQNHTSTNNITPANREIKRRLSMSQQSKFIIFVDQRFMDIQRKFVQSRGLNPELGYQSLNDLLRDIKLLLDFIWYSIDNIPNTDQLLLQKRIENNEINNSTQTRSLHDFGQSSYILKIADETLDYLDKFHIDANDQNTLNKLFKLLFILDKIFAKLISGNNSNNIKLNMTDMIRFMAIAERTRFKLPTILENLNIHGYHYEVSKIYENSLDLCAC